MASVLTYYLENHAAHIRSKGAAERACDLVRAYMKAATGSAAFKVSEFTLPRQQAFMRWCITEHELKAKTISTYLSTIKAAINFAVRPRIVVDSMGREREGRMLSAAIVIEDDETRVSNVTGKPKSAPRGFCPSMEQMAHFLDTILGDGTHKDRGRQAALFRYVIMALNTWARPEAITDLSVTTQVDFQRGLVDLNPPGRAQNKKFRPTIRLTNNLRGWLLYWNLDKPIIRGIPGAHTHGLKHGKPLEHMPNWTFKRAAAAAGLPEMTRYTLRHFMATRIRAVAGIPVSREERATWMGHVDPRYRMTQWYESWDPEYLDAAMRATDAILTALDSLCKKSLVAPGTVAGGRLTVIGSGQIEPDRDASAG